MALKIPVTELLCDLLHETTTPHGDGKLITRLLYTIMWAGGLATVAFSYPSPFLLLQEPQNRACHVRCESCGREKEGINCSKFS